MDVARTATAAVACLAPYLPRLAGEAKAPGGAAGAAVAALYQAVRRRFAADRDDDATRTLAVLAARPASPGRRAAVAEVLEDKGRADPAFARELADLVQRAGQDRGVTEFLTQVYGAAWVEHIRTIGRASDPPPVTPSPRRHGRTLPNRLAVLRLFSALLVEPNDEWLVGRRSFSEGSLRTLLQPADEPPPLTTTTGPQESGAA